MGGGGPTDRPFAGPSPTHNFFLIYDLGMGRLKRIGEDLLDSILSEKGEMGLVEDVCTRIAEGDSVRDVARCYGVPWLVLRKWFDFDPERSEWLEYAKRCYADGLAWDAIGAARDASPEDVAVAKLQADTYMKAAGLFDRKQYGNKVEVDVTHTSISITEVLARARGRVIEVVPDITPDSCCLLHGE